MAGEAAHARGGYRSRWFRSRWLSRLVLGLSIVVAVVFGVRLVLDPLAAHYVRKYLKGSGALEGDFASVHVQVLPPGLRIRRLKLVPTGGDWRRPLLYLENAHFRFNMRDVLRGKLVAWLRIDDPKLILPQAPLKVASPLRLLERLPLVSVDRVAIKGGEFLYEDPGRGATGELWIHDVDLVLANLAQRPDRAEQPSTTLTGRAQVARSGSATLFVVVDRSAKGITFSGRGHLQGLELSDLYGFVGFKADLQVARGALDMRVGFTCRDGVLRGGIRPLLKDVDARPADSAWVGQVKTWVTDQTVDVASERMVEAEGTADVILIRANLDQPDQRILPVLVGVLRNAFAIGLTESFARLPSPPTGGEQGARKQAVQTLPHDTPKARTGSDQRSNRKRK